MRNLSNAQRAALEHGTGFIDEVYDIVEKGEIGDDELYERCYEFAAYTRNGKAATSALCAYIDTASYGLFAQLTETADAIHTITDAPYGSIHVAFDDPEYTGKIASLLFYLIRSEIAANDVHGAAVRKFEEATA